ncbi:MAG: FAD-dependent oxidoreductase [Acidobacteriota bacterium]|nr:FAD-dependent oxidoreductase [Acidobacteriota bacterium]
MPTPDFDCVVIGAGAAGLAAFADLSRAGYNVLCLEARERIGGRIFTVRDPLCPVPVELGAEFIHGRPPEIWDIARAAGLGTYDCADASVYIQNGRVQEHMDAWEPVQHLMNDMQKAAEQGSDQPFSEFLSRSLQPANAKKLSESFVEGFNAARKEVIGIASLAKDAQAADAIDGDRSFRFLSGYDALPLWFYRHALNGKSRLRLNTIVKGIKWSEGSTALHVSSVLTERAQTITARRVIVTIPLGVLHAASLHWDPVPEQTLQAASALAVGQVFRVVFRFREAFWEKSTDFADAGFLLSDENVFPTWWTTLAVRTPILTGWSAGPHADSLLGQSSNIVIARAVASLARILSVTPEKVEETLERVYFHDWYADPFAHGAYSYVPAGALAARQKLSEPVANTLFFAGEATELNGHSATVHGAITSGRRAVEQILAADGKPLTTR